MTVSATTSIMKHFYAYLLTLGLIVLLYPKQSDARLTAEMELAYKSYDASTNDGRHSSADSFTQKYSLLYSTAGKMVGGRLGKYDFSLGYNLASFNASVDDSSTGSHHFSNTKGKLNYNGTIIIDPKEMPFRLKLYSRDTSLLDIYEEVPSSITSSTYYSPGSTASTATTIPNKFIGDGLNITSGATLTMGVKNGMTNGYNEVLRHFPMLMLDYYDQQTKNSQTDIHLSRLAFVSLNKKDNWFHYRYTTYTDKIDPSSNYNESQIQLGTVDHVMQRRWIDFSNWLQISTDGQFTKHNSNKAELNFEESALNFFASARRANFNINLYSSFTRLKEHLLPYAVNEQTQIISYKTNVPLYSYYQISPTASISSFASHNANNDTRDNRYQKTSAGYTANLFTKSNFTLNQSSTIEVINIQNTSFDSSLQKYLLANQSFITNFKSRVSSESTQRYSTKLKLFAEYAVNVSINDVNNNSNSTFVDHKLNFRSRYAYSNTLQFQISQLLNSNYGSAYNAQSNINDPLLTSRQYDSPRMNSGIANSTLSPVNSTRSVTSASTIWIPRPSLNIESSITEDIYAPVAEPTSYVTGISNKISYKKSALSVNLYNEFSKSMGVGEIEYDHFKSTSYIKYDFSRNFNGNVSITYDKMKRPQVAGTTSSYDLVNFEQSLNYVKYKVNGVIRKLFEINENFISEQLVNNTNTLANTGRNNKFTLGARYYPLKNVILTTGIQYTFLRNIDNYTIGYYTSAGVSFKLFEASVDYNYGTRKDDGLIEKRFTALVKKRF